MKKILSIFVYVLIAAMLLYNIAIIVQKISNPNQIPSFLGYKNFIILSESMADTLNTGDLIFVKESEEIKNNEIISFKEGSSIVTHRVIEIIEQDGQVFYKTKGDANKTIDERLITKNEIEGVYCFKIAKVGTIILFFQSEVGIFTFLVLIAIIFFYINKTDIKSSTNTGKHSN